MNSLLNVDIAASAVEPALRAIYDAYAATGARMYTQRWHEPVARMCITLYTWHLHNDRHMFLRRALLGWPKARKSPAQPQREADFDEVFDTDFRTTGFSRPLDLEYACNGEETCDHVRRFLKVKLKDQELLAALWSSIVTGPLEYVRRARWTSSVRNTSLNPRYCKWSTSSPRASSTKWSGSPMQATMPGR
ncbi:hypothetical protein ZWY2020_019578 [Hordeum vulgare]|nr:hypothetical protein ZWY2020_019578 [Hordeum vulgare]